jgi:CRISPR-associated protein Csb2
MAGQLCITVRFLTGRYHGDKWPPSPARLFQALVAGATSGCRILDWPSAKLALEWLERLNAPTVIAPKAERGFSYTMFPPNNDGDSAKVVALVGSGIPLAVAMRQEGMTTSKLFRPWLFPETQEPSVHYLWRLPESGVEEDLEHAQHVANLARNLLALGWGIDVVAGDGAVLTEGAPLPTGLHYIPSQNGSGTKLECPMQDSLKDIETAYAAFRQRMSGPAVNTDTRAKTWRSVPYQVAGELPERLFTSFDLRDQQGEWKSFRWEDGILVAAWLRHAAKQRFGLEGWKEEDINAYICGHTGKGNENRRLSYVPLPSIGHEHTDGRHRRAMIVLPFDNGDGIDVAEVLALLYRMAGDALESTDGITKAWLGQSEEDGVLKRYVASSREWLSVTPMVLHGHDHVRGKLRVPKGKDRLSKTEKLILQALAKSGYDASTIEEFSYQQAPYWRGAGAARTARVPKHLAQWPRYHVRVVFKSEVKGPVLAGIGRHCGLGVFAAPWKE